MKKYLSVWAALLMGAAMMTSCSNDDNDAPVIEYYSNGAYVVNSGNQRSNIDGSVTFINYSTNAASQKMFYNANGRNLGGTVNDGLVYGSKVYIVSTAENTVEVVDKKTFRSIKQIKMTDLLGDAEGKSPRHIVSGMGCVFVSTYGGYVAAIDTASYTLTKKYQVGSYPEGMAGYQNHLIVANSDYGNGNGTLSDIDLQQGTVTTKKIEGVVNPTKVFFSADGRLYVLDNGSYDANWNQIGAALKLISFANGTSLDLVNCTMACFANSNTMIYYVNSPYGATETQYGAYSLASNQKVEWEPSEKPAFPNEIASDPVKGGIYILSYVKGDGAYADYSANGYVVEYNSQGVKTNQYTTGVGPTAMFFDTGYVVK